MSEKHPFVVVPTGTSTATSLPQFITEIASNFADRVTVRRVVGDPQHPKRLVIEATEESIQHLRARFADELLIEPDLPLKMS